MGEADELSAVPPDREARGAGGATRQPPAARRTRRVSADGTVRLRCEGRRGIHTGFVRDVSAGGMFLRILDPEPPGKRLAFELWLPGMRFSVRGIGEVAWVRDRYEGPGRPPGMALRFVALEAEAIARLATLLPGGTPAVEVLERPPLPPLPAVRPLPEAPALPPLTLAEAPRAPTLAELVAVAPAVAAPQPPRAQPTDQAWSEPMDEALSEPMIFVPPPPLPEPVLPQFLAPLGEARHASPLQWGSAAAGIAAAGALATLVVVGAARQGLPAPTAARVDQPLAMATIATAPASVPSPGTPPTTAGPAAPLALPVAAPVARGRSLARRVTGVRWEPLAAGGTRLVVSFDGALGPGGWRVSRIGGDMPRLVVRLPGVDGVTAGSPWQPDTAEVRRLRAGRHEVEGDGEVHLVLDLANPGVRLADSAVSAGGDLLLDLVPGP